MKKISVILFILTFMHSAFAAEWQWSAPVKGFISDENGSMPEGYLWIAPEAKELKAVMFAFQNMDEEALFTLPEFRKRMADAGVALLWIAPGFGQEWNVNLDVQQPFDNLIKSLADVSGHQELSSLPLIPFGHSAQATMPWNFAAWNPERTLCIISYKGDAPRTNLCGYGRANVEWGRTRNIDGIPGLMVMGEYEYWDARLRPALAFQMMYPNSCISFFGDAGRGHFDLSDRTADYIARFIEKSLEKRIGKDGRLQAVDPANGWLAKYWEPSQTERPLPAPAKDYSGCRHEAFWYFDEEMAVEPEKRYSETLGKEGSWLNFLNADGLLVPHNPKAHCKEILEITPGKDDTFSVSATFTDSLHISKDASQAKRPIIIKYVTGPAVALGNGKFKVDRNHPTWKNPRRSGKVTLCAESPATATHKESVQEIEIVIR
ncbi:MAG: hypothetical protein LUD00_02730 [Prevotellaceae bacterium]|nr:hypothetical protein [Prevotellaceae bacterium]